MNQLYCIGDFFFRILCEEELPVPEMFVKFQLRENSFAASVDCYRYTVHLRSNLPPIPENAVTKREDFIVGYGESGEWRCLGRRGTGEFYSFYQETGPDSAVILLRRDYVEELNFDTVFSSLFALERQLWKLGGYVFHCSYVKYKGEAILFSAPSETGKTTQANLWEQYRGSRTVNGDRSLLTLEEDRLIANGWPVCGSSEVCENECTPVRAIVMLKQGKTNVIRRLGGREAFFLIYSQITVNSWNQEFVNSAADFIERILKTVPVYELSCTISEEAVKVLENTLYER